MCTMYESQELLIKLASILYTLLTAARTRSRASAPSRPPAAPSHTSARTSAPSLSGPPPCPLAPTTTTGGTANAQRPIAVPPRADDHHRPHLAVAASPRSIAAARCALDAASTRGFGPKRPNPFLFENVQLADLTAPKGNCKN